MKRYLSKMAVVLALTTLAACNPFRNSIHDTLYGSDTDSSYKTKGRQDAGNSSSSHTVTSSTTTTTVTEHSTRTTTASRSGFLGNEVQLEAAEHALRTIPALSGKDIYLYGFVHFYDQGRIVINVQHPGNPEYIDAYEYNDGAWSGPKPVQLSVHDNIKIALVKLDDLHFKQVASVYRNYRDKSDRIEGAVPPTYLYAMLRDNKVSWYPRTISGSRERYFISFHPDGSLDTCYRE
ncbi:hypothetical protein [Chitinophaga arvensicola]|uniref:Uncharacterized protein n=1 Tax=Chitinophaga arvensicola TaxID=29529 RepID=A0A1I0S7B5_9BACT|nr:hypothetical protein [Chitinophaga arvensicola]SEW51473.1 hypothetical protein SAMN04488122_4253 [Chitinophaga arvensicola]